MDVVTITNGKRTIIVTQKAYEVVFKERGFKLADAEESIDLFGKTVEELDEYTVPQLKQYLDKKKIDYRARATKDDLIALVIGDDVDEAAGIENTSTDGTDGRGE